MTGQPSAAPNSCQLSRRPSGRVIAAAAMVTSFPARFTGTVQNVSIYGHPPGDRRGVTGPGGEIKNAPRGGAFFTLPSVGNPKIQPRRHVQLRLGRPGFRLPGCLLLTGSGEHVRSP